MVLICSSMFIRINLQTVYNIVISNNCTQTHDLKAGWAISGSQSWYLKSPKQKPQKGPAPILIDPPHIYVNLTEHIYLFFTSLSLSFCHSSRLFTECSLLHIMSRYAHYCWLATSLFCYSARLSFLKCFWKISYPAFNCLGYMIRSKYLCIWMTEVWFNNILKYKWK